MSNYELLALIVAGLALAVSAYGAWAKARRSDLEHFAPKTDLDEAERRIGDVERRQSDLEARAEFLPTHEDLAGLRNTVGAVAERMAALSSNVEAMDRNVRMIHQYLLKDL